MNDNKKLLREEYISRINKVQDYIENHLDEALSVEKISQISRFSPYHFHRIFSSLVGETLFEYIQRLRTERAAYLLIAQPKEPVTQIALDCGFAASASFAKAFKACWGMSASQFRSKYTLYPEHLLRGKSKLGKVSLNNACYNDFMVSKERDIKKYLKDISFEAEVRYIPEQHVAYIRHTGPYKEDAELFDRLFGRLSTWVDEKINKIRCEKPKRLTICHDNPSLTGEDKLRISVCMSVPESIKGEGEIGNLIIPGGTYVIGHFRLAHDEYGAAWANMYSKWLPESGYQPEDGLGFELYPEVSTDNKKDISSENKELVDIYIPIKPL